MTAPASRQRALTMQVENGIAVLTFDTPGAPVNTFTAAAQSELREAYESIQRDPAIRATVIMSGKRDNFIAGADIEAFLDFRTADDAERSSRDGHASLASIADGKPVVCAINGGCLGGGTELALACHWRIATESPKTSISLPEVQLGLIPGAGGTQRLPALIGLQAALDMILTGKNVRAKKALQLGLVDEMVHPSILRRVLCSEQRNLPMARGVAKRASTAPARCCSMKIRSVARSSSAKRRKACSRKRRDFIRHRSPRSMPWLPDTAVTAMAIRPKRACSVHSR